MQGIGYLVSGVEYIAEYPGGIDIPHPFPTPQKRVVRILLECFLVFNIHDI